MKRNNLIGRLCAVSLFAGGLMMGCGPDADPTPTPPAKKFDTPVKISAFFEGKTLVMEKDNIPTHPNGFLQDLDFGASSQCYHKVTMVAEGGNFAVTSDLGTITGSSGVGTEGSCDRTTKSNTLSFKSKTVLIENVKDDGACFDVTYTYDGFVQEGRASLNADGTLLSLEIFLGAGKATGHRCADGAVGAKTVKFNAADFAGNAIQKYTIGAN
ncbi:MAG: hypothetical protein WBV82_30770 [Myxococcaceae bacterium]